MKKDEETNKKKLKFQTIESNLYILVNNVLVDQLISSYIIQKKNLFYFIFLVC